MIVFISWSGERSRFVAEALRNWLADVIHNVKPWVSSEDIRSGARWNLDVARRLEEAQFGILCLTKENLNQPWVLFEAGALAKTLDTSHVCPYLLDLKPSELEGPLVQFQAARAIESDTRHLVRSINKALGENAREEEQIDRACRKWWPDLQAALERIPQPASPLGDLRTDRELLEEIVDRIRRFGGLGFEYGVSPSLSTLIGHRAGLFDGEDIDDLLPSLSNAGTKEDSNASQWGMPDFDKQEDKLDGMWYSRWEGGVALDGWINGIARVETHLDFVYMIHMESRSDCFIATRRKSKEVLAGRYFNLRAIKESTPWVGKIVDNKRIDGFWEQGRWDLRRK